MKALAIAGLGLILAAPLHAQGWIQLPPTPGPWHVVKTRTDVSVHVSGHSAQVEVVEWFENRDSAVAAAD